MLDNNHIRNCNCKFCTVVRAYLDYARSLPEKEHKLLDIIASKTSVVSGTKFSYLSIDDQTLVIAILIRGAAERPEADEVKNSVIQAQQAETLVEDIESLLKEALEQMVGERNCVIELSTGGFMIGPKERRAEMESDAAKYKKRSEQAKDN